MDEREAKRAARRAAREGGGGGGGGVPDEDDTISSSRRASASLAAASRSRSSSLSNSTLNNNQTNINREDLHDSSIREAIPRTPGARPSLTASALVIPTPSLAQSLGYKPRLMDASSSSSSYGNDYGGRTPSNTTTLTASEFFKGNEGVRALAAVSRLHAPAVLDTAQALSRLEAERAKELSDKRIQKIENEQKAIKSESNVRSEYRGEGIGGRLFDLTGKAATKARLAAKAAALNAAKAAVLSKTGQALAQKITPVYEESIATGDFKLVNGSLETAAALALAGASSSTAFIRAGVLKQLRAGLSPMAIGEGDEVAMQIESAKTTTVQAFMSTTRTAQGILSGLLLTLIIMIDAVERKAGSGSNLALLEFFGPTITQIRIAVWLLSVTALIGAAEETLRMRQLLGGRILTPHDISQAGSLDGFEGSESKSSGIIPTAFYRLSATANLTVFSLFCQVAVVATVFSSFQAEVTMRAAIESSKGLGYPSQTGMSVSAAISSWRSAVIARFVFAILGWLTAARGQSGPTDMYLQIHEEAREAHVSEEVREETKWGKNNIRIEEEEGGGNEGVTIVTS
jgi:hypothetical protein